MTRISAVVAALLWQGSLDAVEVGHVNDSVDAPRVSGSVVRIADQAPAESAASIYKKNIHAIFTVRSDRELGTGFTFAAGYIVTNAHVVVDSATVEIEEQDGNKFRARVVRKNEARDFAILEPEGIRPFTALVPLLTGEVPEIGEALVVIGSPGGMKGTVTTGIVSQNLPRRRRPDERCCQPRQQRGSGIRFAGSRVWNCDGQIHQRRGHRLRDTH